MYPRRFTKQPSHRQDSDGSETLAGKTAAHNSVSAKAGVGEMPLYAQAQEGVPQGFALLQKQAEGPPGGPDADLLHQLLQRMLDRQKLLEQLNGPVARALAHAYVNRAANLNAASLSATPYYADKVKPTAPGEEEVYKALLGALDMTRMGKANSAASWVLRAAPEQPDKLGEWAAEKFLPAGTNDDEIIEELELKYAKKGAVKLGVEWYASQGLKIVAELESGIGAVLGVYDMICTGLELMTILFQPTKAVSKEEQIVADVRNWLISETMPAQPAKAEEYNFEESLRTPYKPPRDKTKVGP
jgi:hypothetical protein